MLANSFRLVTNYKDLDSITFKLTIIHQLEFNQLNHYQEFRKLDQKAKEHMKETIIKEIMNEVIKKKV